MSSLYHSTLEKYKDLNFRVNIHLAQGPLKWPEPLYKSKIKVSQSTLLGTLNLCLKLHENMPKTTNEFDHPGLRKRLKTGEKRQVLVLVNL